MLLLLLLFQLVFYQKYFSKFVFNSNLSRPLLESEDIAKVNNQNLFHAMLLKLKVVFPLPDDFQCS